MKDSMRNRLTRLAERLADLEEFLSSQNAANDMAQFKAITRERSELLPATERFAEYQSIEADLNTAREWLSDPDMRDMAREEMTVATMFAASFTPVKKAYNNVTTNSAISIGSK